MNSINRGPTVPQTENYTNRQQPDASGVKGFVDFLGKFIWIYDGSRI